MQYERFQETLLKIKKKTLLAPPGKKTSTSSLPHASTSTNAINEQEKLPNSKSSNISDVYNYIFENQDSRLNQLQKILNLNKEAGTVIGEELDSHIKIIEETSKAASNLQRHMDHGNKSIEALDSSDGGILSKISMCKRMFVF